MHWMCDFFHATPSLPGLDCQTRRDAIKEIFNLYLTWWKGCKAAAQKFSVHYIVLYTRFQKNSEIFFWKTSWFRSWSPFLMKNDLSHEVRESQDLNWIYTSYKISEKITASKVCEAYQDSQPEGMPFNPVTQLGSQFLISKWVDLLNSSQESGFLVVKQQEEVHILGE